MAVGNSRNDSPELMQKIELKVKPETNTKLDNFFTKLHKKVGKNEVKSESPGDVKAEKTISTQSPTFLEVKEEDIVAISDDEFYDDMKEDTAFVLDLDSMMDTDGCDSTVKDSVKVNAKSNKNSPIGSPMKYASIFNNSPNKNNGSIKKEGLSAKKSNKTAKPLKKSDTPSPNKNKRGRNESSLDDKNNAPRGSPNAKKKMKTLENFLIL